MFSQGQPNKPKTKDHAGSALDLQETKVPSRYLPSATHFFLASGQPDFQPGGGMGGMDSCFLRSNFDPSFMYNS